MTGTRIGWSAIVCAAILVGCGSSAAPGSGGASETSAEHPSGSEPELRSRSQTQSAENGRNHWIAAGADGRVAEVGSDGVPEQRTARFVNDGEGVEYGSVGSDGWLVASESGWVQKIQSDGSAFGEKREALGGSSRIEFLAAGGGGWLVGGENGNVQEVDRDGQPKGTPQKPFSSSPTVTAAAFGNSEWLLGTDQGELVRVNASKLKRQGTPQASGNPAIVDIVLAGGTWYAFTASAFYKVSTAGGGAQSPVTIASGRTITTAYSDGNTVAVGADDGSVLISSASSLDSAQWNDALGNGAVRALRPSGNDQWVAVGDGGRIRLLDGSGAPQNSVERVASKRRLTTVRRVSDGWWVGVDEISAIQKIDNSLNIPSVGSPILDGGTVREVAAYENGLVAVGEGGKYRFLNSDGSPDGSVETLPDASQLRAVEWNGAKLMVAGDGGRIALLKPDGTVTTNAERMGGADLVSVSWSGRYWLLVAKDGKIQRLRADGSSFKSDLSTGLDRATQAEFNGDQWIVLGTKDNKGAFTMFNEDGTTHEQVKKIPTIDGVLRAADWSGREWMTGGDGGYVARIGQGGSIIRGGNNKGIRNVLYGHRIHGVQYDGEFYLVGGGAGAVRKLQFNTLPTRAASAVNGFATVRSVEWAAARGYPGGPCQSDDFCFVGKCIGGVSKDGFCCESKCEGPCQSCRNEVTGEPDGKCAPVPAGERPPQRKRDNGEDCIQGPKSECGLNGKCDGKGSCAFYGTDVQCREETCEEGVEKSAGYCTGSGSCERDSTEECDPYAICQEDAPTCATSCSGGNDCVEGFVCVEGECIDPDDQMNPDAGTDAGGADTGNGRDSDGCSAGTSHAPVPPAWLLAVPALLLVRLRRRPAA